VEDVRGPVVALVPVRSPGVGKTRLSRELSPDERAALSAAMLADVTGALRGSRVDRVVVAASGAAAGTAAARLELDVLLDPTGTRSLDGALDAARARLGPVGALLIVMADLPRLTAADVDALLDTDTEVAIAGTHDGGTGGLLRRPPTAIETAYGTGSAERHHDLARAAGTSVRSLRLPGFRHDVDTWADLGLLVRDRVGPATAGFLATIDTRFPTAG
jgi:2-phospho-L-lactate guanylyltransferase